MIKKLQKQVQSNCVAGESSSLKQNLKIQKLK